MTANSDFIIRLKGLQNGKQKYDYKIGEDFFKDFGNSQILDGKLDAIVETEKGSGWMKINCYVKGYVVTECDRCLDMVKLPVDFKADMAVKFAKFEGVEEESMNSDEVLVVDPTEGELDLKQFIYDYICINLPLQKVHKEGECNKEMIDRLSKVEEAPINSQFGNLQQMLDEKDKKDKKGKR